MEKNLFEIATIEKYRYGTSRGNVTTEDLWDLSLEDLDSSYKSYSKALRAADEDSLLTQPDSKNEELANKRDIIVYVVKAKQAKAEARAAVRARRQKADRIRELIAQKQDSELAEKSATELQGLLAELDD